MTRLVIVLTVLLASTIATSPVAACQFKFQCSRTVERSRPQAILDRGRLRQRAEIYDPGHGKPLQVRDHRTLRVLGYIEKDGTITDWHRRKVGSIESLR